MFEEYLLRLVDNAFILVAWPIGILSVFFIHEWGHYLAARKLGINVEKVSIGFGRVIWEKTDKNQTKWVLRLIPLKAHVRIETAHPAWSDSLIKRLFVILAGPFANIIYAFLLLSIFYVLFGKPAVPNIVIATELGKPAFEAGLRPGDKILSVNGQDVGYLEEIKKYTMPAPINDEPLIFKYERDKKVFETKVQPYLSEYTDYKGVKRSHGRTGFLANQDSHALEIVKSINGKSYEDADDDEIRSALIKHLGQDVDMGLKSVDRETHIYRVYLDPHTNRYLKSEGHTYYDMFFLGSLGDNIYIPLGIIGGIQEAFMQTSRLIKNVARLPFNLFPIDKESIRPEATVSKRSGPYKSNLFMLLFRLSLFSIALGLINLIPFPGLDGGIILFDIADAASGRTLTNKERAIFIGAVLMALYATAFSLNAPDLYDYFQFKWDDLMKGDD